MLNVTMGAVIEAVAPGSGGTKGSKGDADAPIRMPHTRDQGSPLHMLALTEAVIVRSYVFVVFFPYTLNPKPDFAGIGSEVCSALLRPGLVHVSRLSTPLQASRLRPGHALDATIAHMPSCLGSHEPCLDHRLRSHISPYSHPGVAD